MKRVFILFLVVLLPCATLAQSANGVTVVGASSGAARSGNVIIVNGKKFFLLSNARHFTAGPNSPSALSVMHHPRPPVRPTRPVAPISTKAGVAATSTPGDVLTSPTTPASGTTSTAPGATDVLSIFAPDDKTVPPVAPIK
jgi:hypothetical protein